MDSISRRHNSFQHEDYFGHHDVHGYSSNYRGNTQREPNQYVPDNENCALFVVDLPPTVTVPAFLSTIRNTGRIYSLHINLPEPERGNNTCAAKLVFFECRAAETFYFRQQAAGLDLPGHGSGCVARVNWNRVRIPESAAPYHHTRVLIISGPKHVVNPATLWGHFQAKIESDLGQIVVLREGERDGMVEDRFASYRAQAEAAKSFSSPR
ncbi:hypothetical protein GE09DRAFT_1251366 [Coniochaeta sp. 2T2.1]|nr:hypothetical protein GE09DRAFT_1251366 [Coniochaeta sp. 2T2.1]